MDIKDFEGLTKYKLIIPAIYILSWIGLIFGPTHFPIVYDRICLFFLAYATLKVFIFFSIMVIVTIQSTKIFNRIKNPPSEFKHSNQKHVEGAKKIYHGFILPNYKEEVEMMSATLDVLAQHKRSKDRYLIFLAMEAHEEGSQQKAVQLIGKFKNKFRAIDFTMHVVRSNEQKGKASNVSWCAEHLQPIFQKNKINPDEVFLTILDADSWAPDVYFDVLEEQLIKNFEQRHFLIFQPPQIFTRNNDEVPIFTRVYDHMHCVAHCSNFYSKLNFTFPLSNYTLSYKLVKSIGFWDTCADAIGQDFHTTQKAYWKTGGKTKTIPIYAPFNQVSISTGNGYFKDVAARFWQAERHHQGVADVAWEFKMLLTHKFTPMNFIVFFQIFQIFSLPGVLPWICVTMIIQTNETLKNFFGIHRDQSQMIATLAFPLLFNIIQIVNNAYYLLFEVFRRKANKIIYKRENQSLLRILEYPLIFPINLFGMSVPTFIIAAFSTLGQRQYKVAIKKMNSNKSDKSERNGSGDKTD